MAHEDDAPTIDEISKDERASKIWWSIFDKTEDGAYSKHRDGHLYRAALAEIMALGYGEADAREFMNESFSLCEDADVGEGDDPYDT